MAKNFVKKHDELARKFLTNIEIARNFLQTHLAQNVLIKCDLNTLTIESGSFVSDDLREFYSDIVYRANFKGKSDGVYIYCLLEHQSEPVKLMPFRVLEYTVLLLKQYINTHGKTRKLPMVVPVIVYNGQRSPYPYSTDIRDVFQDKELFDQVGLGSFNLVDLTIADEEDILKHGKLALFEMLQKHIRDRDFNNALKFIMDAILVAHDDNLSKDMFDSAWTYLAEAREQEELAPLMEQITDISDYEGIIMSYAETLKQQGMQQGIQQGMQQGMQQGKQEAEKEIAKNLLKSGVDINAIKNATHLSDKELEQLKASLH